MEKLINITLIKSASQSVQLQVKENTPVHTLFSNDLDSVLGVKINNETCALDTNITYEATIEGIYANTKEGSHIYRRSLCFILAAAAHKLFPKDRLLVGHSLGYGYYYTFNSDLEVNDSQIASLGKEMSALIKANQEIITENISYNQAIALFDRLELTETRKQLDYNASPTIKINTIGDFSDLYYGPLTLKTGILKTFELMKYGKGFLLRFPKSSDPSTLPKFKDQPKLFEIYSQYKEWGKKLGVTSAASLNELIAERKINDFIDITEIYQQKNFSKIASQIIERKSVKVVLIAGPSSSGKTTSAKKLGLELQAMGYTPKIISLDCYYVGRDKTPLDKDGKPDFECIEALNIELLNQNLIDLFDGKEVNIPSYDFHTGTSYFDENCKMSLMKNEILILEGIHGLNDRLTSKIPSDMKFKIYLSALTQLNLDDHNRIPTSDNRLIRRIVRDYNFRGKSAEGTIQMWQSVRNGEELHIFPFQNNADAILNTALDYELSVLRVYAAPLLRRVTPNMPEYSEARRLLSFLENFATIPQTSVPDRSILREFIGGSTFKY